MEHEEKGCRRLRALGSEMDYSPWKNFCCTDKCVNIANTLNNGYMVSTDMFFKS